MFLCSKKPTNDKDRMVTLTAGKQEAALVSVQ